jgi:pimeloyl-ACP methyl ester carboxylesterase
MNPWTPERMVEVGGGIELCHQELGAPDAPPVVLVMGIGAQMVNWPDGFCELIAERGFRVIRFDNRDCGRSTWLTEAGVPSVTDAWQRRLTDPPYLLADMAGDVAGLLEALEIGAAHIVGASLGGFVAQTLAIERPERMISLTSISSSTGQGAVGYPTEAAMSALMTRPASDRDGFVQGLVAARRVIGSPGFELDEQLVRDTAARAWERGLNPDGTQRQLVASICSGSRTDRLRGIEVPTLVMHGADDPLIHVSGGRATAAAIPGARLVEIDGWGHDLPPALWDRLAGEIAAHAASAARASEAAPRRR